VFCGPEIPELPANELAQSMRMQYSGSPIFYITRNREGYERKDFIKNGFDDSFLMPLDEKTVKNKIENIIAQIQGMDIKVYRAVKLVDLDPDTVLDFDVSLYMPANKKYIKYSNSGDPIDSERVEKLKKGSVSSLYVPVQQMQKFYSYTAGKLADLSKGSEKLSETERKERLHSAVRDVFASVFNVNAQEATIQEGKKLVEDCQGIVKNFILKTEPSEWYNKLQETIASDDQDSYSHASNVSTFAGLFAIGAQMGKPEDLAIAGLFHDLGLGDIPQEILNKPEEEWTKEESNTYYLHPEYSIRAIKQKKLIVPAHVQKAIIEHHERFDGSGHPKGLVGSRIGVEAQILGLADQFDYMTRIEEGKQRLTPRQAIQKLMETGKFNPELTKKVLDLFPKE